MSGSKWRGGQAESPEESDVTSIQERIRAWQKATVTTASAPGEAAQGIQCGPLGSKPEDAGGMLSPVADGLAAPSNLIAGAAGWRCPIESDSWGRGILQMTAAEYLDLVDKSGRMTRSDKRGAIDAQLAPVLLRIGANPADSISRFGSRFHLAAGFLSSLREFADQVGRRWLKGVASARAAFASTSPQAA